MNSLLSVVQTTGIAQRLGAEVTLDARTGFAVLTAGFDGRRIGSEGFSAPGRAVAGLVDTLAALIPDHRDAVPIAHSTPDILRARIFAIACGISGCRRSE
jgi:hypothetical protein